MTAAARRVSPSDARCPEFTISDSDFMGAAAAREMGGQTMMPDKEESAGSKSMALTLRRQCVPTLEVR